MSESARQWGEARLVEALASIFRRSDADIIVGIGDDAAVVETSSQTVVTCDSIMAGQDWLVGQTPPEAIGRRAAAVNLSDLAAMGASPCWAIVALELHVDDDVEDLLDSVAAFDKECAQHGVRVVGGDLGIGDGPQRWTVTLFGAPGRQVLRMDTARPGDRVWLVGEVGAAAVGLQSLLVGDDDPALKPCLVRHLWPHAHVDAGQRLAALEERVSATDISDGLWLDALRLASRSGVGMELSVPQPEWLNPTLEEIIQRWGLDWREAVASGGDDYALLLCAPWELDVRRALPSHAAQPIGRVRAGSEVLLSVGGQRITGPVRGYQHGESSPT